MNAQERAEKIIASYKKHSGGWLSLEDLIPVIAAHIEAAENDAYRKALDDYRADGRIRKMGPNK